MVQEPWGRRLRNLRHDPIQTIATFSRHASRRAIQKYARARLAGAVPLGFLSQRPGGACAPDYADLWFLYQLVRRLQPRVVLEFGSGCSTIVIGHALRDNAAGGGNQAGQIHSLDADRAWADVTRRTIAPELESIVQVVHTALSTVEVAGTRAYIHDHRPDVVPDLVYLDGPAFSGDVHAAADMVDIEPSLRPGFHLVVDGRLENVALLRRALTREYLVTDRPLYYNTVFELVR